MAVYLVAMAEALFYLFSVPGNLALAFDSDRSLKVSPGVSAFVRRRARRRAEAGLERPSGEKGARKARNVWRVVRRLRFERVELSGSVATGDAAATALLCGSLNGLACGLRGRTEALSASVRPDFSNDFQIRLHGMLSARSGQIMMATIRAGREALFDGKASDRKPHDHHDGEPA